MYICLWLRNSNVLFLRVGHGRVCRQRGSRRSCWRFCELHSRQDDVSFGLTNDHNSEEKANMIFAPMSVRSCRVTIQDMDGVSHTVEVTAATLYEAVAQGLAAIRGNEWVAEIVEGFNFVKVS